MPLFTAVLVKDLCKIFLTFGYTLSKDTDVWNFLFEPNMELDTKYND